MKLMPYNEVRITFNSGEVKCFPVLGLNIQQLKSLPHISYTEDGIHETILFTSDNTRLFSISFRLPKKDNVVKLKAIN